MSVTSSTFNDLVNVYAKNSWEKISNSQEYRRLCEENATNSAFQTERSRVEKAAVRIQASMRKAATSAEEVITGLELLRRTRSYTEDLKLYHDLISASYKARWRPEQQDYFEQAYEKLQLKYDFFFSFTTRYEEIAGENPVNNLYKHFILRVLTQEEWKSADRRKENLLAKAIFTLLAQAQGHVGFFFPDSQYDNTITEKKLDDALGDSLVFIQLVQNVMFRPPRDGTNYCFYEYVRVKKQLDADRHGEYRMLFLIAERSRTSFVEARRIHPDYEHWHTQITTRDVPYLPEVDSAGGAQARFREIRSLIQEKLAAQVEAAWDRVISDVPS